MSDSQDVALAAAGNYEAFERLYRRYFGRIYSLCARLSGSRKRGTELSEEVFVRAWHELPNFSGDAPFAAWLHRLATNDVLAREHILHGGTSSSQASAYSEAARDPAVAPPVGELDLSEAISQLHPAARGIFVLHDVEGYDYEEVAEMFGITVGACKARLQQARVLLKEALGR
jgi:RNA polymerase sigma-70 factor (ECF subfamily)